DRFQARAHAQELLVNEVVVRAAEGDREVGLADPADGEPAGRVENRRLHPALVHDAEPALRVVHAAPERSAHGAIPPVLRVIGPAPCPGTALALLSLEVRTELLGRLGDVTVGVVHGKLDHRALLRVGHLVPRLTAPSCARYKRSALRSSWAAPPGFWPRRWAMASRAKRGGNRVMSSAKVFIFAPVEEARDSHRRLEAEGCELRLGKASWDTPQGHGEPELIRMAQGAHALMGTSIRNVPISRKIMESSPELRVVAKYTIGVDDVDVEAATEMGSLVCHGPTESNWGGVAEGTITAMLTMLKRVRERDRHLKDGGAWRDPKLQGTYLGSRADGYAGITLGLIGLGRIGSRIATLLRPWQMRILATDPYVP